jgi:hypothetical protein
MVEELKAEIMAVVDSITKTCAALSILSSENAVRYTGFIY